MTDSAPTQLLLRGALFLLALLLVDLMPAPECDPGDFRDACVCIGSEALHCLDGNPEEES